MQEFITDVLIIGGGTGGYAAALSALRMGKKVILTEETDWIGGQLTAQGVPPDENPWIDSYQTGCTASYRAFRDNVRDYYRRYYPLLEEARNNAFLNPGQGSVSPLCMEPRVALAVLDATLAPYLATGALYIFYRTIPVTMEVERDRIRSVIVKNTQIDEEIVIEAKYILDATELGDLLPLAEMEHVIGAESHAQTGEMHARTDIPNPLDQQAISWCFAIDYLPGETHVIEKPTDYDFWRGYQADFWPAPQLSWQYPEPVDLQTVGRPLFAGPTDDRHLEDMWHFRRILYRKHHTAGAFQSDVVIVNWPQIDYWLGPLVGVSEVEKRKHLRGARQLSLALMYWMQTEAPRHDSGYGYPGLRLRGDMLGTDDLAMYPYIRESRRIQAEFTILEEHVGVQQRGNLRGAEKFSDSVGIGSYRIDLHPSTGGRNYIDITNWPFQIPLGALIPVRMVNLLPAGKNIGTTHITNGCYRLHPVEWNIGEAAGALAAFCIEKKLMPHQVRNTSEILLEFQGLLVDKLGFVLTWPEELRYIPRDKMDPLGI